MDALMHKPTSSTQLAAFYLLTHGGMSCTMVCNAALIFQISNFYSSFKPNFSRIIVRVSSCSRIKPFDYRGSNVTDFVLGDCPTINENIMYTAKPKNYIVKRTLIFTLISQGKIIFFKREYQLRLI